MWNETALTRLLGIDYPIVQGPFGGGLSSVALTATVSNAGGLGSFGAQSLTPDEIPKLVRELRQATDRPFAVNLWVSDRDAAVDSVTAEEFERFVEPLCPLLEELGAPRPVFSPPFGPRFSEQVEALLEARPPVFSFIFGVPSASILERCRSAGITTIGTATTVAEARALQEAGVDAIVATGAEAGGHRVSFLAPPEKNLMGTFSLVQLVRDAVSIPVIAAGGVVNGRSIAAMLVLGADGVQIGSAFLATEQSKTTDEHRRILRSRNVETVLTRAFTGRLARGIPNRLSAHVEASGVIAPYPIQRFITGALRAKAIASGKARDYTAMWAGQCASLISHADAAELFASLVRETAEALRTTGAALNVG